MYEIVEKENVLNEINNGATLYVVDIPTRRVMACNELMLVSIRSFIDKSGTMFFKVIGNE